MSTIRILSLAAGEIAPAIQSRVDLSKYQTGLKTMRNSFVQKSGGSANRPGTQFVGPSGQAGVTRLIEFIFNNDQSYILSFEDQKIRFIQDGSYITLSAKTITAVTQASQGVVTSAAHGYSNGDLILITGVGGMGQLNYRYFVVSDVAANTFKLKTTNGVYINTTLYAAYTSGGSAFKVYTLASPYLAADLFEIQYTQNADVMTLVHPSYVPRELARTAATSWALSTFGFIERGKVPTAVAATGTAGASPNSYMVTSIDSLTGEESVAGLSVAPRNIVSITAANPIVVTTSGAHGFPSGAKVRLEDTGMTQVNDREFQITNASGTTFELVGEVGTTYTASGAIGFVSRLDATALIYNEGTAALPITISWNVSGNGTQAFNKYYVYKSIGGAYGFIGVGFGNSFKDIGYFPDTLSNPPVSRNPFASPVQYPAAVAYVQQRLAMGGSSDAPESVDLSRIGSFHNFRVNSPVEADDAISMTMNGRRVNDIKFLIDVGKLLIFTTGGEFLAGGDSGGTLTPSDIGLKQISYNGSGAVRPLVVNGNALYIQGRGSIVRDLSYDYRVDSYNGNDLTVFASHLFEGYTIVDWAYQQTPNSIIWAARSDGTLLGLTYLREHEIWAWHRHDFDGAYVESVAVVPEGDEDALYAVMLRSDSAGNDVRYIERLSSRFVDDIADSVFMDSAITYDGRNTGAQTMTLAAGTAGGSPIALTSSTSYFSASDVGDSIHITGADGEIIRFTITAYNSATVVHGHPNRTVPASIAAHALTTWSRAISTVFNLWHLEGLQVSVLGDGQVVASPNNPKYGTVTVSNGQVILDQPYSVIHAGVPYLSDLQTLDIDQAQGETLSDKKKLISAVTLSLEKTRGVWVGAKPPTDDTVDALEGLDELKIRESEGYDEPVDLLTGTALINIRPEWNSNGRVFIRQTEPLPISVLSISPAGVIIQGGG